MKSGASHAAMQQSYAYQHDLGGSLVDAWSESATTAAGRLPPHTNDR